MSKILSFEEFSLKSNESGIFVGVETQQDNSFENSSENIYRESKNSNELDNSNNLKLTSTDFIEFATLKNSINGKNYIFYFDSTSSELKENYGICNEKENYTESDKIGIELAANDILENEIGFGAYDWENGEKPLVELDEELTDDMIEEFNVFITQGTPEFREKKMSVKKELEKILSEIQLTTESLEFESEDEVLESEGIHPAVREKLIAYLKDNADATYSEAKKFIREKIAGWDLTAEDFEEAKKLL